MALLTVLSVPRLKHCSVKRALVCGIQFICNEKETY
jgi:hypothetical protein